MHYVYLNLYYLSLVMMWIAGLLLGGLVHWATYVMICRVFATDAKLDKVDRAATLVGIALVVLATWFLVNRVVAMLGDINAL